MTVPLATAQTIKLGVCDGRIKPSIVFAHGIWADGSSFSKLIPPLQADGHEVMRPNTVSTRSRGDVAAVKSSLGRVKSPAILVGHSYGGPALLLDHETMRAFTRAPASSRHDMAALPKIGFRSKKDQ
jgi:pimeloyl-ACP methyl ester carboxylesterase